MQQCKNIEWAFEDVAQARQLWPRVKEAVEAQIDNKRLHVTAAQKHRIITAVVSDLLGETPKGSTDSSPMLSGLMRVFRRDEKNLSLSEWIRSRS